MNESNETLWWKRSLRERARRFLYVAIPILGWLVGGYFHIFGPNLFGAGSLFAIVVLYILAFPLSLFLRLDLLYTEFNILSNYTGLLLALPYVLANFLLIGLFQDWRKKRQGVTVPEEKQEKKRNPSSSSSRLNGHH